MPKDNNQTILFNRGLVTARDAATFQEGELQQAEGCEYHTGSPHVYKQPGRASSSAALGAAVRAIHKFQYDLATDKLIAVAGTSVFESNVFTSGASGFSVVAGLTVDGTAIPYFSSMRDSWLMFNGVDSNYIREAGTVPSAVGDPAWPSGNWRPLGMQAPSFQMVATQGTTFGAEVVADTDTNNFVNSDNARDTDFRTFSSVTIDTDDVTTSVTETYTFPTSTINTGTGRFLNITHAGTVSNFPRVHPGISGGVPESVAYSVKIEVSENAGGAWTTILDRSAHYQQTTTTRSITDALNIDTQLQVRITLTRDFVSASQNWGQLRVFSVYITDSTALVAQDIENSIFYGFTERYYDSDGVMHESSISPLTEIEPVIGVTAINLTLPGAAGRRNTFAHKYVIYRSLDAVGEGYPNLWEIAEVDVTVTNYVDTFALSLTTAEDKLNLLETLPVLYPDGTTISIPVNVPPPKSKMALPFQGSMVYVPVTSRRLHYSLPTTLSARGAEQVPELYYMEFVTPRNDDITTIARSNGGRSLLVFFENYTMLVTYLPQATDPGVFDQRIIEYVSNTRGASGVHCAAEVTLDSGRTLCVAVDDIGVWATDGVSIITDWSVNQDWGTLMSGVTLSGIQLVDNPEMDRVELLYTQSGTRKELHLFYGTVSDGQDVPFITGPHTMGTTKGIRSKHYNTVSGSWIGWSGDNSATGDVFIERAQDGDASLAYDGTTQKVPFQVKSGDYYVAGLGGAHIVNFGYPKFGSTSTKLLDPTTSTNEQGFFGTFRRDGFSSAFTKSKSFDVGFQRKLYWHAYADRHTIQVKDISTTAMPALVAYEVEVIDGGDGRDL